MLIKKKSSLLCLSLLLTISLSACTPKEKVEQVKEKEETVEKDNKQNEVKESIDFSKTILPKEVIDAFYPLGKEDQENEFNLYARSFISQDLKEFTFKDETDKEYNTKDFKEKDFIIEFFATTCPSCTSIASDVDSFNKLERDEKVYSISYTDQLKDIGKFKDATKVSMNLYRADNKVKEIYNVKYVPTFLFVSKGVIQFVHIGEVTTSTLEKLSDMVFDSEEFTKSKETKEEVKDEKTLKPEIVTPVDTNSEESEKEIFENDEIRIPFSEMDEETSNNKEVEDLKPSAVSPFISQ